MELPNKRGKFDAIQQFGGVNELCVEAVTVEDMIAMRYPSSKIEKNSPIEVFPVLFFGLCFVQIHKRVQVRIKPVVLLATTSGIKRNIKK